MLPVSVEPVEEDFAARPSRVAHVSMTLAAARRQHGLPGRSKGPRPKPRAPLEPNSRGPSGSNPPRRVSPADPLGGAGLVKPSGADFAARLSRRDHTSMTSAVATKNGPAAEAAGPAPNSRGLSGSPMTGFPSGPAHWGGTARLEFDDRDTPQTHVVTLVVRLITTLPGGAHTPVTQAFDQVELPGKRTSGAGGPPGISATSTAEENSALPRSHIAHTAITHRLNCP